MKIELIKLSKIAEDFENMGDLYSSSIITDTMIQIHKFASEDDEISKNWQYKQTLLRFLRERFPQYNFLEWSTEKLQNLVKRVVEKENTT